MTDPLLTGSPAAVSQLPEVWKAIAGACRPLPPARRPVAKSRQGDNYDEQDWIMPLDTSARPRPRDGHYLYATDNGWSADRYAIFFADGVALVVWTGGHHSAWSDADAPVPHLAGSRLAWRALPAVVRREVHRRCAELDSYLPVDDETGA
jgi:hypothetical protein